MPVLENLRVEDAAMVIFGDEHADKTAGFTLNNVSDGFDLFLVCTKLLLCGVRNLYSPELDVDGLSTDQLQHLTLRFLRAGVLMDMRVTPVGESEEPERGTPMDIGAPFPIEHVCTSDGLRVEDHALVLRTPRNRVVIKFHVFAIDA